MSTRHVLLGIPDVGDLSVVERPDRAPLSVPTWYQYTPGGELCVHTGPDSRKAQAIRLAGRFSLMVQRAQPTVRNVSVEGPVTRMASGSREQTWETAARYLAPDKVADFVDYEQAPLGEHVAIYMRPAHWISADLRPG